jgi:hypothetical protein
MRSLQLGSQPATTGGSVCEGVELLISELRTGDNVVSRIWHLRERIFVQPRRRRTAGRVYDQCGFRTKKEMPGKDGIPPIPATGAGFRDNLAAGCIVLALSRTHAPLNAIRLSRPLAPIPIKHPTVCPTPMQANDLELKKGDSHRYPIVRRRKEIHSEANLNCCRRSRVDDVRCSGLRR